MSRPPYDFESRKEKIVSFVNAVKQLNDAEGIEHVSIRKIAKITGFNSASLYSYFKDVEHLILFTSVGYFRDYTINLSKHVNEFDTAYVRFMYIWQIFCETAFSNPHIFYNMFFGKYSDDLEKIMKEYYAVFPEELVKVQEPIVTMLGSGDILNRNFAILEPLIENRHISADVANEINEIIVYCFKGLLWKKCQLADAINNQELIDKQLSYIKFILQRDCSDSCLSEF